MSAVVACGDDGGGGTTTAETEGTSSTTDGTMSSTSPSTSSSSSGSSSSTTADTTSESSSSTTRGESESTATDGTTGIPECAVDGGEAMCDPLPDQEMCEANEICLWSPSGYCYGACTEIEGEDACCSEFGCVWFDGHCDYGGV